MIALLIVSAIVLAVLFAIESQIKITSLRMAIMFVIFVFAVYGSFSLGARLTEDAILSSYSRDFYYLTSYLYKLSESKQYKKLHTDLKVLKEELPAAISNDDLAGLLNRIIATEEIR